MVDGKGQRKWPIPPGFVWSHNDDCYKHPDGRVWNSDTNAVHDEDGTILAHNAMVVDSRQIEGGGPRVLPADIEAAIKLENYHVDGTLTICVLTLQNGFRVTGESACADPANFNVAKGQELARKAACEKIWPLLGYVLRDRLHRAEKYSNMEELP